MDPHHIRNGIAGIYAERLRLLGTMLEIAEELPAYNKRKVSKRICYKLHSNLVRQIGCIHRMDKHLRRVLDATKEGE